MPSRAPENAAPNDLDESDIRVGCRTVNLSGEGGKSVGSDKYRK